MTIAGLIHLVIVLLVIGIIIGLLYYIVKSAPFIPEPIKSVLAWVIIVIGILIVIVEVLLPMAGGGLDRPLFR